MMLDHFNDLLKACAGDGASAAGAVAPAGSEDDVDQIMDAWYRERQERVEAGLFLEQARELLGQIVAEGRITPLSRRKARRLLLAIQASAQERAHRQLPGPSLRPGAGDRDASRTIEFR